MHDGVQAPHNPEEAPLQPSTASLTNLPLVTKDASIRTTMEVIDRFAKGIAIVVDDAGRLRATVTDGDVRRAILAGVNLDQPVSQLQRPGPSHGLWSPVKELPRANSSP